MQVSKGGTDSYLLQLWEGVFSRAQLELHAASLAEQLEALYACA